MFTGIVQACLPLAGIDDLPDRRRLTLDFPPDLLAGLQCGASVAVDGVCLTVAQMEGARIGFDAVPGTLARTTLGDRTAGQRVNIERAARLGAEIGGHPTAGHISETAVIAAIATNAAANYLDFTVPPGWEKYIFARGYIALNGCSLTVAEADRSTRTYRINLIPETIRLTSFGDYKPGDRINFEIDPQSVTIVDTLEHCFAGFADRMKIL